MSAKREVKATYRGLHIVSRIDQFAAFNLAKQYKKQYN